MLNELSLAELAEAVGLEPRTIRAYIAQGLLRGPETVGRNARYGGYHVDRLRAIRVLKDFDGKSIAEVRAALLGRSEDEVRATAERWGRASEMPPETATAKSVLDYVRNIRTALQSNEDRTAVAKPPSARAQYRPESLDGYLPLEQASRQFGDKGLRSDEARFPTSFAKSAVPPATPLLGRLIEAPEFSAPTRSRSEVWFRMSVTPDVELGVRGPLSPEQRAWFERIAQELRGYLLGGNNEGRE